MNSSCLCRRDEILALVPSVYGRSLTLIIFLSGAFVTSTEILLLGLSNCNCHDLSLSLCRCSDPSHAKSLFRVPSYIQGKVYFKAAPGQLSSPCGPHLTNENAHKYLSHQELQFVPSAGL